MKGKKHFYVVILVIAIISLAGCRPGTALAPPTEPATWTSILGLLVPLIAAVLQQSGWSKKANSLIALGLCLIAAVVDAWYFGQLDNVDNLANVVKETLIAAFLSYKMLWQPLGFTDWFKHKTTFRRFKAPTLEDIPF